MLNNISSSISNIINSISNLPNTIITGISGIFGNLITNVGTILDYLNPLGDNFILKKLWVFLTDIISFLNPSSDNFFGKKIIELIGDLLKTLFIPKEDYFSNIKETLLSDLETKLPYNDFVNRVGVLKDVATDGQLQDISIEHLQIGDIVINVPNFIDFSYITKYRATYYIWVRGFMYIFLIIYNINQLLKFLRGFTLTDGSISSSSIVYHDTSSMRISNNNNLRLGGGKK